MSLSRRQFLQGMALFGASAFLAPAHKLIAAIPAQHATNIDHLGAYLTAMETPYAAPMNIPFERVIGRGNIGVLLYDLENTRLMTALAPENPLPVASAFKAPVLMYFVDTVDPAVWNSVPVTYWNTPSSRDVPEQYRESFREHQAILQALYNMIVISDNPATGIVLSYVARLQSSTEPLALFNDWSRERVGTSQLSALSAWSHGIDAGVAISDARYIERGTTISGGIVTFENMMTPRDIGLYYMWMIASLSEDGQQVCRDVLSIIRDNRGANLERLALDLEGTPYSKNGSLIMDEGTVIADAGLIELPDSNRYLLVMLSLGAPELIAPLFEELNAALRGRYNELIHNRHFDAVSAEELQAIYLAHLREAYPQQTNTLDDGIYHYGFIIPEGVDVYGSPDDSQPLHNPIIRSTRFGIRLLMQGALVRYVDVDSDWVELMPDNDFDNVRARLGTRLFVKREDIWQIGLQYSQGIARFTDHDITADDKFVVISLVARELAIFEGATPVLRIPIVLNEDATPRGVQVITSKWFARSMQPWAPGVPFTSFFGSDGYALHGSPWQRWSTTVNRGNITGRSSAGCVNIPDWLVRVGDYHRPADELLFRWIGGMENPQERVFEYPSDTFPAIRIYNVDYPHNLQRYVLPAGLTRFGGLWQDAIDAMTALPLQAPETFFV